MKVLVVNAGSSSLKFTMYRTRDEKILGKGLVERIGLKQPRLIYEREDGEELTEEADVVNHEDALKLICDKLVDPDVGVLNSLEEVQAVGHRVVHGAEKFSQSVKVNSDVKRAIRMCASLAPLHNPPNLGGIEACEQVFPDIPNVAVFDTAYHQSMPPHSYLYAMPQEYYREYGIRKYGFHGTSHNFVAEATAKMLGKDIKDCQLITCHLGNGCSIAAIKQGKVLDTSMGLTPLSGLVMGTRCGDIDPGVILYMLRKGMTVDEMDSVLNKESGLLGVAEIGSSDMRDLTQAVENGDKKAETAINMFVHRLVFYIGGYYALLGKPDAVVFTGGIGEKNIPARTRVAENLQALGCYLDYEANQVKSEPKVISTPESTLKAIVMPTDEELMIARETVAVLG